MKFSVSWLLLAFTFSSCSDRGDASAIAHDEAARAPAAAVVAPIAPAAQERVARYAVPIDGLPVVGERDALVTIVELTDYDCPFCARAETTIASLRRKYGHDVRVAVAETPLPMHEHARDAALAALAANAQGRFEPMHDALFSQREHHTQADLARLGVDLGLSPAAYERDRSGAGSAASDALARSMALASSLHVSGTPMFFVNGRIIRGAQPFETFDAMVSSELANARAMVASGTRAADVYARILDDARAHPMPTPDADEPAAFVAQARGIGGAHLMGARDAQNTIVLFTDFQCPYCAKLDARLRELTSRRSDVRVVLRHHPLPMHPDARLAAKAAIAADLQGKLTPFARLMFEHQGTLEREHLIDFAARAGADPRTFERDLDAPSTEERLAADEALASRLDVRGTPTSFIDGHRVVGAQPIATFEAALAGE
jgi:protein-disulfide isomerase